jgi:tetratricopeptide (TPR) repeat protein
VSCWQTKKEYQKAEAAFQKAVELNRNNSDAFFLLAQVQSEQGAQDRAIASCQHSIQEPFDVRNYMSLGALEETRGNWQKSQELYERALQVAPVNPLVANNLAYSMLDHGGNVDVAFGPAQAARRGMPNSAAEGVSLTPRYSSSTEAITWHTGKTDSSSFRELAAEFSICKTPQVVDISRRRSKLTCSSPLPNRESP